MVASSNPIISIGLAVFNGEKYLEQAIRSILDQSFKDFELIISDNASSDSTYEICKAYLTKDPRIQYYRQSQNFGPIKNFEFVLEKAKGKYFMWFAADDLAKHDFVEKLYLTILANPSFVLVMSDVENISETNQTLNVTELKSIRIQDVKEDWKIFRNLFFEVPTSNIFFCIYGLYVTEVIKKIQLNYKGKVKYATASEIPILAQVSSYGMIGSIEGPLKIYRRHNDSVYNHEQNRVNSPFFLYSNQKNLLFVLLDIVVKSKGFSVLEKIVLTKKILKNLISLTIDFLKNRLSLAIR